jgi:general secretion pathway protein E
MISPTSINTLVEVANASLHGRRFEMLPRLEKHFLASGLGKGGFRREKIEAKQGELGRAALPEVSVEGVLDAVPGSRRSPLGALLLRPSARIDLASAKQNFAEAYGQFLLDHRMVDRFALGRAERAAVTAGERLDLVLTKLGLLSEAEVGSTLARYLSLSVVSPTDIPDNAILPDLLHADFVRLNAVMPLATDEQSLTVGVIDPFNDEPIRAISYLTGLQIIPRLFLPSDFEKAFGSLYARDASETQDTSLVANDLDVQRLRDLASEAPTIKLVNEIIADAVEQRASDVHIEPSLDALLVRYRIDGGLRTARQLTAGQRAPVTSRLKIMANLDIAERRLPQDGRIKIAVRGNEIDFRISTIPTAFGESVVMRILDRSRVELDLEKLGFSRPLISALDDLLREPNGIILVTGPTGSGKTTTLYTLLKALNSVDRKLFTVEDPIEYQLARVNQVQVQPAIGLDFPHALRSILRQDPDIIMIGEIRDLETARIAIQASLTGHLVFSTLHTNSAAATMTRLLDMGVESYLLASTVKAVLAQRLVRRLCPNCSAPHVDAAFWTNELRGKVSGHEPVNIRQPNGCAECGHSGFSGRTTIAELLPVTHEIQSLVQSRRSDVEIESAGRRDGMTSMYEDGTEKVWRGETTIEEVLRATRVA